MGDSEESIADSNSSIEIVPPLRFIDKLYQKVSKDENVLISPISVEIPLAMIYQGAVGETAEKFATALDVPNQEAAADKYKCVTEKLNGISDPTLHVANKIFIMKDFPLKTTFENVIEEFFMSQLDPMDFSDNKKASDDINQWVEEKTENKIRNVISPDCLDDSVRLVLLSALYLKSNWEKPFLEIDTTMQPFYISEEEAVDCEMMFIAGSFKYCSYHSELHGKLLELPYKNKDVSMIIILPGDYQGFEEMESNLGRTQLSKLQNEDMQTVGVEVFLPKFKIEATINVKPLLEKMGLETIFAANTADFSGISESAESVHVSQFLQKTSIEVDENETEAASDTESSESRDPVQFTVDRPFMFVLRVKEENSSTVLCVGKVLNPTC